jgi:hypothetical protein
LNISSSTARPRTRPRRRRGFAPDSAWILASDHVTEGIATATLLQIGDFDDDDLDDALVIDLLADEGWLYLGGVTSMS